MKSTKLFSKILLVKSSVNNFIFLPAFYLIMCLMEALNNFEKIAILKTQKPVSFFGAKTHFGKLALKWRIKKEDCNQYYVVVFDPIEIFTYQAPQNDRQNLSFVKVLYIVAKKWPEMLLKWPFLKLKFSNFFFQNWNTHLSKQFVIYVIDFDPIRI